MQIKSINILIYRFRTNITLDHKYMQNISQPVFRYGEDQLTIGRALHLARGIEKGILTSIKDIETRLIGLNIIDSVSDNFSEQFDKLLQLID